MSISLFLPLPKIGMLKDPEYVLKERCINRFLKISLPDWQRSLETGSEVFSNRVFVFTGISLGFLEYGL